MKNKVLSLIAMAFVALFANAQSWTEPEMPSAETPGSDVVSGHVYKVKNVEAGQFLTGAAVWYGWSTSTALVDYDMEPLSFKMTENFDDGGNSIGWTFARTTDNKVTFISGSYQGKGEMHVDMASQGHQYFDLLKQDNGYYRIRIVASDSEYGEAKDPDWEKKFWGWEGLDSDYPNAVYGTVNPDDGFFCDWEFIDVEAYELQMQLFNLAVTIEEEGLDVDYEKFTDVYKGTNTEALKEAISQLKELIGIARTNKVLEYGEDGYNPPSDKNPADATSLIVNSDFSMGNIEGWTDTYISSTTANNHGYQSASYNHGEVSISQFIETWADSNGKFNPNVTWRALGNGELSQTLYGMPEGKYLLEADCIANQQDGQGNPVTGVQLFAQGADYDNFIEIATGNGEPEHFELVIVATAGEMKIGVRTIDATANWVAADNFTLTYYGKTDDDPAKVALDILIEKFENQFGIDIENLAANNEVKAAYEKAMSEAVAATGDYQTYTDNLNAAGKALAASVSEYEAYKRKIDDVKEKSEVIKEQWGDLDTGNLIDELMEPYDNGTYTAETGQDPEALFMELVGKYISENLKAGDDITVLLQNPGFEYDNSGWEISNYDGTGGVSAGNHRWGGENITLPEGFIKEGGEELTQDELLVSGCVEIWRGAFKYQQTIPNMPAGLYKLSCKGFQRNEDNQSDTSVPAAAAELFAITGDKIQTQKFANIFGDCSENMLYNGTSEGDYGVAYGGGVGTETDLNTAGPAEGLYYPNGMCGASAHFAAGYYKQEFNFVLTEPSDVTIGARCQANYYWTLFDDFQLTYMGKDDPTPYMTIIERLQDDATAITDNMDNLITKELAKSLTDAIDNGYTATTVDECVAAIEVLRNALAEADAVLKKTAELYKYYNIFSERSKTISSSDAKYPALLSEIDDKMGDMYYDSDKHKVGDKAMADNAEVDEYIQKMFAGFTSYVQADRLGATESAPEDITDVIYNPDCTEYGYDESININGWTTEARLGFNGSSAEIFNQNFEVSQTIFGLAPGFYRLYVNAFYREAFPNGDGEITYEKILNSEEGEHAYAFLFAGDKETHLKTLANLEDMESYQEVVGTGADITIGETSYKIANNMDEATSAFDNGLYENCLQFEVAEGQESVTIGIREWAELIEAQWFIWDNWRLEYLGKAAPAEDASTAISDIETATTKAAIYNLAGQRVVKALKGVYIVNGKKVVVK